MHIQLAPGLRSLCHLFVFGIATLTAAGSLSGAEPKIRVVVWDEQQPQQKQAYENFLGNAIAAHLEKQPGLRVVSANLQQPEHGLSTDLLDNTDVLIWWGHVRQQEIPLEKAKAIVERIKAGRLSLIALHSAHWSRPFVEAMNERTRADARKRFPDPKDGPPVKFEFVPYTGGFVPTKDSLVTPAYYAMRGFNGQLTVRVDLPNCVFPSYRGDGKPSTTRVLLADHPIAKGLPKTFQIPQTEMYDEPFHVPEPDEVVMEETWEAGERFRSGCVWKLGEGRVFYYRPGHETFPVYRQELPLQVLTNAVEWLGTVSR
ncbi:MAG: ThuA domain-containing protein [Planctomycetota bacterium]|nr:ThuA domain-containing protein [Planctomycetota bacterium]